MYNRGFDPYDMLIELKERMHNLEHVHNKMANSYYKLEAEMKITQHSLRTLQQKFLELQIRGDAHGQLQLNQERPSEI